MKISELVDLIKLRDYLNQNAYNQLNFPKDKIRAAQAMIKKLDGVILQQTFNLNVDTLLESMPEAKQELEKESKKQKEALEAAQKKQEETKKTMPKAKLEGGAVVVDGSEVQMADAKITSNKKGMFERIQ